MVVKGIIDGAADTSTSGAVSWMLDVLRVADKFGEGFVRNVLAIRGEYLYLLAEDKDVA